MVNEQARDYWSADAGPRWVRDRDRHDRVLRPFHEQLMAVASLRRGEFVLDVGCGSGTTTIAAALAVGATGRVVGVDFSPVLLAELDRDVDEGRRRDGQRPPVETLEADAQTDPLPRPADAVISRLGVMFFDDPHAAWRNIADAVRPGGRLSFVCWQTPDANRWIAVPTAAAQRVAPPAEPAPPPDAPGPFSLADPQRTTALLTGAGWEDIRVAPVETSLQIGKDIDDAIEHVRGLGAVGRAIETGGERLVVPAVREAISSYVDASGAVTMDAAAWIVTATRRR